MGISTTKPSTKKHRSEKTFCPEILPKKEHSILFAIRYSDARQQELATYMKMSRQAVAYYVKKLINYGFIYDPAPGLNKYKFYEVTTAGQKALDEYESHDKTQKQKIENSRWKAIIHNTKHLQKFLYENKFAINPGMKNWTQYVGKINGCATHINIGKKTSIVITHNPLYDRDVLTGFQIIRDDIVDMLNELSKKWNFEIGLLERIKTAQFTSPDPVAADLMKKSSGSQLKVGTDFDFNQSHGSEARTEITPLEEAVTWSQVPGLMKSFVIVLNNITEENKKRDEIFTDGMAKLVKGIEDLAKHQINNSDKINELTVTIAGLNQSKFEQKSEQKIDLNEMSEKMFG